VELQRPEPEALSVHRDPGSRCCWGDVHRGRTRLMQG
jgi:hypothetical protein